MGHQISALVSKDLIDEDKALKYDLPVFKKSEFAIVALNAAHADYWDEKLGYEFQKVSDIMLDTRCTHFFAKELGLNRFAIIYTEYFGGTGEQSAAVYDNGQTVLPPASDGINDALKMIGVQKAEGMDEFDTIGLGEFRNWDGYFDKYDNL